MGVDPSHCLVIVEPVVLETTPMMATSHKMSVGVASYSMWPIGVVAIVTFIVETVKQ